ncbi:MAG TPA: hypothetical protein VGG50_07530 [Streptosporangiaceae bacterium]
MRRTARLMPSLAGLTVAVPAGVLVLAGCGSSHHGVSTSAGAPRSAPPSPAVASATAARPTVAATGTAAGIAGGSAGTAGASGVGGSAAAAAAPGHRGSVTVAESKPVLAHGTATAPVTCETSSAVYVALVSRAQAGGYTHSFTVRVAGYHGPGRYRGTLSATVTGPHATVAALTGVTDPAVTVTGAGGTFAISTTGSGDHTLDATVSWACP